MTDILTRLQAYRPVNPESAELAADGDVAARVLITVTDWRDAIAEIEHLRSLAGKVSRGFTFADIKAQAKNHEGPHTEAGEG